MAFSHTDLRCYCLGKKLETALIRKERHDDAVKPHGKRFAVLSCDFCRDMAHFILPLIGFPITNCYTLRDKALTFSSQTAFRKME